jgi:hypothetical protein
MRQALEILGLSSEGEALPSGRFALIELPLKEGGEGVRRIFETPATEYLSAGRNCAARRGGPRSSPTRLRPLMDR